MNLRRVVSSKVVPRMVVKEPLFEEQLALIEPDAKRVDEFLMGTEWVLARYPQYGTQVAPNSNVWAILSIAAPTISNLVIYYTFNDDRVHLMSVSLSDDED